MAPRPPGSRPLRTLLAALVAASVAVPVSGAARPSAVPAPAPVALAPLRSPGPGALAERYAVNRDSIRAAERMAEGHGDRARADALRVMAGPARQFLSFDGRDGGRTVEVFGDLARADRIAVLVPGSDTNLDRYERLRAGATALRQELGGRSAVVAWLGYETPATMSTRVADPGPRRRRPLPDCARSSREMAALPAAPPGSPCSAIPTVPWSAAGPLRGSTSRTSSCTAAPARVPTASPRCTPERPCGPAGATTTGSPTCRTRRSTPLRHRWGWGPTRSRPPSAPGIFAGRRRRPQRLPRPGSVSLRNLARIVSGQAPAEEGRHA